ncbi:MAG: signal peptidase I [Jatrophihabitans sp.]|uniref:signal peptidase I n=1 Tax=Jatrophihabitans sp. TaxID=1932789 RepID=UPI003F7D1A1D
MSDSSRGTPASGDGGEFDDEPTFDPDPDAEAGEHEPGEHGAGEQSVSLNKPLRSGDDEDQHAAAAPRGSEDATTPDDPAAAAGKRRQREYRKAPWWELPALIALAVLIAVIVKTFVVQPFYIPSASMEHTLYGATDGGDRILVNKVIYDFRDPHPGDIVVFNAPPGWNEVTTTPPSNPILHGIHWFGQLVGFVPPDGEVRVKRVIATGGQTVWGDAQGHVHVRTAAGREKVLTEPYVFEDGPDQRQTFGPVTVPKGRLWVMGDHRNDSQDSRYHCDADGGDGASYGPKCNPTGSTVPVDNVIGKAFVVAWPPSHWRTLGTPTTFSGLAAAANRVVPAGAGLLGVLPLWFVRRRRRRRA